MGSAPPSPQPSGSTRGQPEVNPAFMNPSLDRRHAPHRPSAAFTTRHQPVPRRPAGKPVTSDLYQETEHQPIRGPESKADAVLTRLCGCDKLLQSLAIEMAQLRADKDSLQCTLEMTRLQLEEWGGQEGVRGPEGVISQQAVLQEELVQTRARICDVATEQSQAQREIWMIEDILCGLSPNKNNFRLAMGSSRQTGMTTPSSAVLHRPVLHPGAPVPSGFAAPAPDWLQSGVSMDEDLDTPPPRPPLPQEHHRANQNREAGLGWLDSESESEPVSPQWPAKSPSVFPAESSAADTQTAYSAPCWPSLDSASKVKRRRN
nr:PREDICTED: pleckstrin homology domain-containing family A member 7-like [Lepisosteus oculatus]